MLLQSASGCGLIYQQARIQYHGQQSEEAGDSSTHPRQEKNLFFPQHREQATTFTLWSGTQMKTSIRPM